MAHNPKSVSTPPGIARKGGRCYRVQYIGTEMADMPSDTRLDIPSRITAWLKESLPGLSFVEQKDVARMAGQVSSAFAEFDTPGVQARHILQFLNQWTLAGKLRTAQRYRAILSKFFSWTILQGDRQHNPVAPVSTKSPPPHDRYITDDEFLTIRANLLGDDHVTASGPMMQVYVDLLYLTGQRGQDVRLLRWSQVDEVAGVIRFKPGKTAKSSGAKVEVPITGAIAEVLGRARELVKAKARISPFVVHARDGSSYGAHGVGTAWDRARKRAGINDATLKDLRAKHATDAKRAGYSEAEIQDSLAHEDTGTTRVYLKQRVARQSRVELALPSTKTEK